MRHAKVTKNAPKGLPSPDPDAGVRSFLARSAVLLALISLILYEMTREPALLLASSFAGIAIVAVYCYYFKQRR